MATQEVGNLSARVGLDTAEFNRGVKELSQRMQIMQQEFRNASAGLDRVGNAAEISRLNIARLTGQIGEQRNIVDRLRTAHQNAATQYGETSRQAQAYELRLLRAEGQLQSMERQLTQTTEQLRVQSSVFTQLGTRLNTASTAMMSFGKKMTEVGKTLSMSVTLPIVGLGAAAAKLASDLNESLNKVDVAFKKNAQEVKTWSDTTLKSFGIAKGTALDMSAKYGDMATSMGLPTDKAAKMSEKLVGLAGDLASFKNISIDIANTALTAVFTGETESLKQLGIVMTQANLQEYAASQGIKKKIQDMTQAEQTQLRYNYVLAKTVNAQGDFIRTGDGTANSTRVFQESLKQLGATMGQNILPVITPIIQKLSEMAQKFGELSPQTQKIILVLAGIAAAIGPVSLVVGSLISAFGAIAGVVGAASTAIAAAGGVIAVITGPIGIAIAVIAALVAGGVLLYKNWDTVKAKATELANKISEVFTKFKTDAINWGKNLIQGFWNGIDSMTAWIKSKITSFVTGIGKTIKDFFGIQSPSKLMAEYGQYIAEGLAVGIEKNTNKVTEAADKMASAITGATDKVKSNISLTVDLAQAKFDLLKAKMGETTDEAKLHEAQLVLLNTQMTASNDRISVLTKAYEDMKKVKGEAAAETQKLALELLKEQTAQQNLAKQMAETNRVQQQRALTTKDIDWTNPLDVTSKYIQIALQNAFSSGQTVGSTGGAFTIGSANIGSIPKFDVGTDFVPRDMLAIIHKGEKITPAKYNTSNVNNNQRTVNNYNITVKADDLRQVSDVVKLFKQLPQAARAY